VASGTDYPVTRNSLDRWSESNPIHHC
jgi:hypothetical protein